jgi:4-hydroxy-tetrahydrodipicolinate synthase
MVTPFDDQLKVDFKAVARLTEHLIGTGTTALVVSGTTGESPTLETAEKLSLLREVLRVANGKAKVIMGTGSNDTARTVKLSLEAEHVGADGLLVVAPYYNKPSALGLVRHFEEVSKAISIPIILYNIPGRTGVNIAPETIIELAQRFSNLHAVKESSGNVDQSAEIAARARDEFLIYSGDDYLTLPIMAVGGCGVVSVASHFAGRQISSMMENFFAGDLEHARGLHYNLLPLFKGLFAAPNPTCTKYALSRLGICSEHLRLPLVPLESAQRAAMDNVLRQCDIIAELSRS